MIAKELKDLKQNVSLSILIEFIGKLLDEKFNQMSSLMQVRTVENFEFEKKFWLRNESNSASIIRFTSKKIVYAMHQEEVEVKKELNEELKRLKELEEKFKENKMIYAGYVDGELIEQVQLLKKEIRKDEFRNDIKALMEVLEKNPDIAETIQKLTIERRQSEEEEDKNLYNQLICNQLKKIKELESNKLIESNRPPIGKFLEILFENYSEKSLEVCKNYTDYIVEKNEQQENQNLI